MSKVQKLEVKVGIHTDQDGYLSCLRAGKIYVGESLKLLSKLLSYIVFTKKPSTLTLNIIPITELKTEPESILPLYSEVVKIAVANPALTHCPAEVGFALALHLSDKNFKEGNIYIAMQPLAPPTPPVPKNALFEKIQSVGQIFLVRIEDNGRISLILMSSSRIVLEENDRIAFVEVKEDKKEGE